MRTPVILLVLVVLNGTLLSEEGITPQDPQLGRAVDFYQDVYPILERKCLACHSEAVAESDLVLENAKSILKGGASGEAVVPGKPEDSYLYLVASRVDEPVMPPLPNKVQATALTPKEVGIFRQWILEGAKSGTRVIDNTIAWQPIPESYKAVYSLALDPDRRFVYAGRGNRIFVYDLLTGKEAARLSDPSLLSLRSDGQPVYGPGVAHRDFVHALALSPDGKRLASGGFRVVKIWQRQNPLEVASLDLHTEVKQVAISDDDNWAVFLLSDNQIQLWNLTTGQAETRIAAGNETATSITFGPESNTLLIGTESGTIRIASLSDGTTTEAFATPAGITAILAVPESDQLVTAHQDNIIRLWNLSEVIENATSPEQALTPVRELTGHTQPASILKSVNSGKELISASPDSTVRIWNLSDGNQVFSQNLDGPVRAVASDPSGQFVIASGENTPTRIWSRDGKQVADVTGNQQLAARFTLATDDHAVAKAQLALADQALKDSQKDLAEREESLKTAQEQKEKTAQELADNQQKSEEAKSKLEEAETKLAEKSDDEALKKAKEKAAKAFETAEDAFKKSKDALKSAERAIQLSEQSIELAKKNVADRQSLKEAADTKHQQAEATLASAKAAVDAATTTASSLSMILNGQAFVTAGIEQPFQLWNAKTGQPAGLFDLPVKSPLHTTATNSGSLLTVQTNGKTQLWDLTPRWNLVTQLGVSATDPLTVTDSQFEDRVTALAFHPDGKLLATGGGEPSRNGELMLWNIETGELVRSITDAHSDAICDIEFSRDGTRLLSGATDKFVKLFRVEDGSLVRSFEGHTDHVLGVTFKADGSNLASSGADLAIKIWNTETGEQIRTISNYEKQVTSVSYIGVTDNLISCSGDHNVKFHTASNGRNYRTFSESTDYVYAATATDDESLVIAAGEDGAVRIWNGKDGKLQRIFDVPQATNETVQR